MPDEAASTGRTVRAVYQISTANECTIYDDAVTTVGVCGKQGYNSTWDGNEAGL